nr:aminoglycoside phosphotransferase family protein [Ruegeria sp.]
MTDHAPPPFDLVAQLGEQGLVEPGARFETLYGGRTNQVWKVQGGHCDSVLKLYRTTLRNPLFGNDAGHEAACLRALQSTGFVPNLRATGAFEGDRWVLYDHAPGAPWRQGADKVGRLLRKLHGVPAEVSVPPGCNGSADLARHGARILAGCQSDRRDALAAMQPQSTVAPSSKTCLVHGDPVPGNILEDETGLTLIDWQCPVMGDPCEDLAMFLSPAMQHLYRSEPLSTDEEAAFLVAYDDADTVDRYQMLKPWYAWRMAAYCLWRAENGSPDYLTGLELELAAL